MSSEFLKVTTTENTNALIRKDHISAIEEIPGSARTENYFKIYVAGYSFKLKSDQKHVLDELKIKFD